MNTRAWMLRQDGEAFPVSVHLYVMGDDTLASEAEVASFLLSTKSKDSDLSKYIIDCWLALLIEQHVPYDAMSSDIDDCIRERLSSLPFKFPYPLTVEEYLDIHHSMNNYYDVDSLYDFVDEVRSSVSNLSREIAQSLNQQFCRVRHGGKYNTEKGSSSLWFRISSVGYNWANTIYVWTANHYRGLKVSSIFICRDAESDGDEIEYFYKAKDGTEYYDMPIDEYLNEEHEHSPVFSCADYRSGFYRYIKSSMSCGMTYRQSVFAAVDSYGCDLADVRDRWNKWVQDIKASDCVSASEFLDNATVRQRTKFTAIQREILKRYPELDDVDIDVVEKDTTRGHMTEIFFKMSSDMIDELDGVTISTYYSKPVNKLTGDIIVRGFGLDYDAYCENNHIDRSFRPDKLMPGYVWGGTN